MPLSDIKVKALKAGIKPDGTTTGKPYRVTDEKGLYTPNNQLLVRYQVALDGELYKALEALRKQQEWRLKCGELLGDVAI